MKSWKWMSSLLAVLMLLGACSDTEPATEEGTETNDPNQGEEIASDGEFPVTVRDATGEDITIEEQPEQIVSMIPSNTEIAYALGLNEEIVGVSDYDNYPEEVNDKEKIGGLEFNVEKIISLQPDVVLAHDSNAMQEDGLQQIRDAGITVVVIENAVSFEQVYDTIEMIGQITGKTGEAEEVVADMQEGFAEIEQKAAAIEEEDRKDVLVDVSGLPEIYVAGSNTFMQEMLDLIQADNVAGDQEGFFLLSEEEIVSRNPEAVVLTYGEFVEDPIAQWMGHGGFSEVAAVQNEEVHVVSSDPVNRSGPRLVEGTQELAEAIYPDIFSE
ncbi:ABC transporter substrate-binding protein [Jeotgalibacillus proteolyticus]|uniref:ABC transporter substrate-binding protein n=1 Tax=Jeotgalibacillus proteolyticus TaxID=2082395 RepID=A0A2S5G9K1_9BACL|nr:ABC transporter substrate-binding protein [Jeotgalibacillus proteolyticus]PPA69668.1 ABC transporter substrate-binding protein [Jeotgalibacillus proteolyticus]